MRRRISIVGTSVAWLAPLAREGFREFAEGTASIAQRMVLQMVPEIAAAKGGLGTSLVKCSRQSTRCPSRMTSGPEGMRVTITRDLHVAVAIGRVTDRGGHAGEHSRYLDLGPGTRTGLIRSRSLGRAMKKATLFPILCMAVLAISSAVHAANPVARGAYLVILGDCAGCHTNGNGRALSGGQGLAAAFGTVYSANITPDRQTGIGNWSPAQFYRAMHDGIRADGAYLYPAFPFPYFSHISRADTDAIFAYLKSLKPVHSIPPQNRLLFPVDIRETMWFWDAMFLDKRPFRSDSSKSTAWNRGASIVNGLGHCAACHTPKSPLFGDETDKAFTGVILDNWFSANLTGDKRDGLGAWTAADIVQYLKTGRNAHAVAAGPMQQVVAESTSHTSDSDLAAIAAYLKDLPAAPEKVSPSPDPHAMQAGQVVFVESCSACHMEPGSGEPRDFPKLAGDTLVVGRDPTTVLHIVLKGAQSAMVPSAKTGYSMPSFAALSDQDIADVTTYVRNAWGNRASPVSRDDVLRLRKMIAESD